MTATKPSLELLRSLTGEHVLRALMDHGRLTRAEIAGMTGISKPTVAEGVRRLEEAGIVVATGERTSGRGRSGSYYALSDRAGYGLVAEITRAAVTVAVIDPYGTVTSSERAAHDGSVDARRVAATLRRAARSAVAARTIRVAVVSAADPVDRSTGRLVALPDSPFLVGDLDPVAALSPLVAGPVHVDNDVNWAARAERSAAQLPDPDNFVYLHLGEGLGCAVVCDGHVWRGHAGLAGEISHITTRGIDGSARAFTELFAGLALRRPGSAAIDETALERRAREPETAQGFLTGLARAIGDVCQAAVALADPSCIVLGGTWGSLTPVRDAVQREVARSVRPVPVVAAGVQDHPAMTGATADCLIRLRDAVVAAQ